MSTYPWSESGLELLAHIQAEMRRWNTPVDELRTVCNKPNCAYCNYVAPIHEPDMSIFIMSDDTSSKFGQLYSPNEINIIKSFKSKSIKELMKLLPGRSYSSINIKKHYIKNGY